MKPLTSSRQKAAHALSAPGPAVRCRRSSFFPARFVYCLVTATPDLVRDSIDNGKVHCPEAEGAELFSQGALVADYQYALRYYRALKQRVTSWQSAFMTSHDRYPNVSDAEVHGGHEFALLYGSFLEIRTRLLIELPRLKDRLQQGGEADGGAEHGGQHEQKRGGERGSVNANRSASGAFVDPHPQQQRQQPPQMVDSVSTWLQADRYRRQRTVAAAAAAEATTPMPQLPVTKAPAATRPNSQVAAGFSGQEEAACAPYNPVTELTPLSQLPMAAAGSGQTPQQHQFGLGPAIGLIQSSPQQPFLLRDASSGSISTGKECITVVHPVASNLRGQATPAGNVQPQLLQQFGSIGEEPGGEQGDTLPMMFAPWSSPAGVVPSVPTKPPPPPHMSRLAEDVGLAADSRAKNALLAALQYKRTDRTAGSPSRTPQLRVGPEGRGLEPSGDKVAGGTAGPEGPAGHESGGGDTVPPKPSPMAVLGEVQRGDAVGVYAGRNRRAGAHSESFMVCP